VGKRLTPREKILAELRSFALGFPEAVEEFPWDEPVVKVRKKIFVFMGSAPNDTRVGISVKLPQSGAEALSFPWCEPTGYGLGKAGWVSVHVPPEGCPTELLMDWIEESYRTVAPKTLVKQLDAG
jgi:predicted DNA-binding protein (MmcQ/YjbR family)